MKTRLIRIGNSRGIRLPKPLIEEAGLSDEVEIRVRAGSIVIVPTDRARAGWDEAARALHESGGDQLIDVPTSTDFDTEEWQW
jgi:antitoxin MazE